MVIYTNKIHLLLTALCCMVTPLLSRNILRPKDKSLPTIHVSSTLPEYSALWNKKAKKMTKRKRESQNYEKRKSNASTSCNFTSRFLQLKSLKNCFRHEELEKYLLPNHPLSYRNNPAQQVPTDELSWMAEQILEEIIKGKKKFTHFTILKDSDFNYKLKAGLLVLKYKKHPFVLKLFIEHPHTFTQPFNKGFAPSSIFCLSGTNRHMSGLTRIRNLHTISKMLDAYPMIDFVRKWFWLPAPDKQPWLHITWNDPVNDKQELITLPSIYGIIADFIIEDTHFSKQNSYFLHQLSINIANKIGFKTDPHVGNFIPELHSKNPINQEPYIVIIDTEHFPTIAGFDEKNPMQAKNYVIWYMKMCGLYIKQRLTRLKPHRIFDQYVV